MELSIVMIFQFFFFIKCSQWIYLLAMNLYLNLTLHMKTIQYFFYTNHAVVKAEDIYCDYTTCMCTIYINISKTLQMQNRTRKKRKTNRFHHHYHHGLTVLGDMINFLIINKIIGDNDYWTVKKSVNQIKTYTTVCNLFIILNNFL